MSVPRLGVSGALKTLLHYYRGGRFSIRIRGISDHFQLRGKSSDLGVLYSIACHGDYAFPEIGSVDHVIDCGAYNGISALTILSNFQPKRIIAVEPDADNFDLLSRNCAAEERIQCIHGAIWSDESMLRISNPSDEKWGFQCQADKTGDQAGEIQGYTMWSLIRRLPAGRRLVKMDIEGAEQAVFQNDSSWLREVDYLVMEIHPGCWKNVFDALANYSYDCRIRGENILFVINHPPRTYPLASGTLS
jgi:FkbM family methyltransferase